MAIEALGFILSRSPAARTAFTTVAEAGGLSLPADLSFATQVVAEDDGRPDIEGYGSDLQRYVVVETKFHAGLTQHQPITYAARLPSDHPAALVFIVPAGRMTSLWRELSRRLMGGNYLVSPCREVRPELWAAAFSANHHLVLVSWRMVLIAILREMETRSETDRLDDVRQLQGLCERMDTDAFIPMRSEELTGTDAARRYVQLGQIAYDVGELLLEDAVFDRKGLTPAGGLGFYGRYLRAHGIVFFLTFDGGAWAAHKLSPLWLRFDASAPPMVLDALRRGTALPPNVPIIIESPRRVFVALAIEPGAERPEILRSLASQVEGVMTSLSSVSLSAVNVEAMGGGLS